jgi:glutamyl-tRNA synthetase
MGDDLRNLLFSFALQNAVKYGDLPQAGTVIAKLMGEHPEYRPRAKEVTRMVGEVIREVAALSPGERRSRLEVLAPHLIEELCEVHTREKGLPPLEAAEKGVVMRFAPNPSGPLHLGHARAAVLNDAYVRKYGGKYVLRIEDTDPRRVDPDAYRTVQEDIAWLGLCIDEIVYQSDRLDTYYEYAERLIDLGGAYVCTCENEQFREMKLAKKSCPCRTNDTEKNLELWQWMLDGKFYEGAVALRVKTDLDHPDPAMRDFSAFRIVSSPPHPRVDEQVFPLMNFSVAVDDHLLGITHVIRGKDHIANTVRQRYIFDYFGWKPPVYRHYGRMGIEGVILSTSQMRAGIGAGTFTGWDDIHLGTLRAIARRGISPDAVKDAVLEIGIGETDISFSWDNLYAHNRDRVDPMANRYFFVPDPIEVRIEGAPEHQARPLLHPGFPDRGVRTLDFHSSIVIPAQELAGKSMLRLKDLFNVTIEGNGTDSRLTYAGDSLEEARKKKLPVVQWLPVEQKERCILRTQEGDVAGFCEPAVSREIGKVIQFERIGFARIDSFTDAGIVAYFTHR